MPPGDRRRLGPQVAAGVTADQERKVGYRYRRALPLGGRHHSEHEVHDPYPSSGVKAIPALGTEFLKVALLPIPKPSWGRGPPIASHPTIAGLSNRGLWSSATD